MTGENELEQIGLIGGIGPAATDYYYRRLIARFAAANVPLELTIVHADTTTLLDNLAHNRDAAQVEIYQRLSARLAAAGAGCVVVTSIAGHFCIDRFIQSSPLPVIDMLAEVGAAIKRQKLKRVGILGTRTVMQTRFYGGIASAEVIPPAAEALDAVHEAYVAMAASGVVTAAQRAVFDSACEGLIGQDGVEAVMLGGTDLALVYDEGQTRFPVVDCAAIHVDAIVRRIISEVA